MENLAKYIFWLLGLCVAVYLVILDKKYPETKTNDIAFWLIGGYISFVFAWPKSVGNAIDKVLDKVSDFSVSFQNKDE